MNNSQLLMNAKKLELKMRQLRIKKNYCQDFTKAFKLSSDIQKLDVMRSRLLKEYYRRSINTNIGYKLYSKAA